MTLRSIALLLLTAAALTAGCLKNGTTVAACESLSCEGGCQILDGEPTCVCPPGYTADGSACIPVVTCESLGCEGHCDPKGDTPRCVCTAGFRAEGARCLNVDECADELDDCHPAAFCSDSEGGYTCTCGPGFEGDGLRCSPLADCGGPEACDPHASCVTTGLGPRCRCDPGYFGDGESCTENVCGDGRLDEDEEACDDGNTWTEVACDYGTPSCTACDAECTAVLVLTGNTCGDGDLDMVREACDDGNLVTEVACPYGAATCSACAADCRTHLPLVGSVCGDGVLDPAHEVCDDGNRRTETVCRFGVATCTACDASCSTVLALTGTMTATCGDGVRQGAEQCDTAGSSRTCSAACTPRSPLASGNAHTCVIRLDGGVACWGSDDHGELGDGGLFLGRDAPGDVWGLGGNLTPVRSLGATWQTNCAVLNDGSLECWGSDVTGQIGDGLSNTDASTPVQVIGLDGVAASASLVGPGRGGHSCAVLETGALACWGSNYYGQLGTGSTDFGLMDTPQPVLGIDGIAAKAVAVSTGDLHTCAVLEGGAVQCWGRDILGMLGSSSPVTLPEIDGHVAKAVAVAAGEDFTCAMLQTGEVWCWGADDAGQLGDGGAFWPPHQPVPVEGIDGIGKAALAITAGDAHACALLEDGAVWCWGEDLDGELGRGSPLERSQIPVPVFGIDGVAARAVAVAAGANHTCALLDTEEVRCWGSDDDGQLGDGPTLADRAAPVPVASLPGVVSATERLAVAKGFTCAVNGWGAAFCWGYNLGSLGRMDGTAAQPLPKRVLGLDGVYAAADAIYANHATACAKSPAGALWCWGDGSRGQIGDGTNVSRWQPTPVQGIDGVHAAAVTVAIGKEHVCAVLGTGALWCWGGNTSNQLGTVAGSDPPREVIGIDGSANAARAVAAGGRHTCALLTSGAVVCWGSNGDGVLGIGIEHRGSRVPVPVNGIDGITGAAVHVASSWLHTCAVMNTGAVRCWGRNLYRALGHQSNTSIEYTPVTAVGLDGVSAAATRVATGTAHSCALLDDGSVRCWGRNDSGQVGAGSARTFLDIPTQVVGLDGLTPDRTAIDIAAGENHTCAILASGNLRCWGGDGWGQLGDDQAWANGTSAVPVTVLGLW